MMKKKQAEPIGSLILQMLRKEGLEAPLQQHRLLAAWADVAGAMGRYTSHLSIRKQVLTMHVSSSACRQELLMRKAELIAELNRRAGGPVIVDIAFF